MKLRELIWVWVSVVLLIVGLDILGCGRDTGPRSEITAPPSETPSSPVQEFKVVPKGVGFGYHCGQGFYSDPQLTDLELWACPLPLASVELAHPLQSIIFQADCRKKTLDVRSPNHSFEAMTWEVMPDGNFNFTMDGGKAQLKSDGSGHLDCGTPVSTEMWGRIDCSDPDKPVIHVESLWWLDKPFDNSANSGGAPTVSPTARPNSGSSGFPSSALSPPSSFPSTFPSTTPSPVPSDQPPFRDDVPPAPARSPLPSPSAAPSAEVPLAPCQLPTTCYLHNISHINQCQ